jgi:hypothetical protein
MTVKISNFPLSLRKVKDVDLHGKLFEAELLIPGFGLRGGGR